MTIMNVAYMQSTVTVILCYVVYVMTNVNPLSVYILVVAGDCTQSGPSADCGKFQTIFIIFYNAEI